MVNSVVFVVIAGRFSVLNNLITGKGTILLRPQNGRFTILELPLLIPYSKKHSTNPHRCSLIHALRSFVDNHSEQSLI
jgi:hypothetical protein